jgi:hypothetical protein
MKFFSLCTFLSLFAATQAQAENFRFNPTPLRDYDVSQQGHGNARLKISVSFDNAIETKSISVGGVVACSSSACFRPNLRVPSGSSNSLNGTATLIVDSLIPETTIEKVYFEELKGGNLSGSISLASPLKIDNGFYGGEIYITLTPSGNEKQNQYKPSYAASNLIRESGQSIYYNPKFAVTSELGLGVTLSLPVGALQFPAILNAQVSDVGDRFAMVDIYPYVKLSKPMTVTTQMIESEKNRALSAIRVAHPSEVSQRSISLPTKSSKSISKLGLLKSSFFESSLAQESWQKSMATTATSCLEKISTSPPLQQIASDTGGIAVLDWCRDIPPFIHIIAFDLINHRLPFSIPYTYTNAGGYNRLALQRLGNWVWELNSVGINGFYWEGDIGTGPGQTGLAAGYVLSNNYGMGGNRVGGGWIGGTGASAGNKILMAVGSNYTDGPINWLERSDTNYVYPGAVNQLSSSTSALKDGYCSGDSESSRWSFIGTSPRNGVGVLISSTSDGVTSAVEMCDVLRLMLGSYGYAMRLDGGPSAAMMTGGVHQNPLTGAYSFKYGTARYIAYGIKLKFP